ncbi:MAG: hypothetical protein V1733_09085 [bacterium]
MKTTAPDAEQSATCLAQDARTGHRNTWYYGTGELLSTTNRNISTNIRTVGIGNGIFKSTDNGESWQPLASTQGGSPAFLQEIFQGVWRIAVDPVALNNDIVYAALSSFSWSIEPPEKKGIWRSTNGLTWKNITPEGFPTDNRVTCLALAPSNENILYVFTESQSPDLNPFNGYANSINTFWKMSWNPVFRG